MMVWDLAARRAQLVEEAGGIVTDWSGGGGHLLTGDVAAGSPATHPVLLEATRVAPPAP
jgi:myo-inositol-1(or 4)-monophosphatase